MLKFLEKFDRMMAAAAFAEANLHETALEMLHERSKTEKRKRAAVRPRSKQEERPRLQA